MPFLHDRVKDGHFFDQAFLFVYFTLILIGHYKAQRKQNTKQNTFSNFFFNDQISCEFYRAINKYWR